jgi:transcriptional regulator with XRE-family HTH domain
MSRRFTPVEELASEWMKDPEFRAAYDALEDEFALASALIEARGRAGMTQAEVAQAMGTTQAVIARLEGGRSRPSTRTLERFAAATGSKLRIRFEPIGEAPARGTRRPRRRPEVGADSP